jgi:dTMP kinase
MKSGRLIAFEGGEASGKSTQARLLADHLGAVLTREPGATEAGARIRELVLGDPSVVLDARTEALLLAADRAAHVAEVIAPALARGDDVVTDRFIGSSLAYQGYGRGLDRAWLQTLSYWATDGLDADVVVLLDVAVEVARTRRHSGRDRIEAEDDVFHQRVADGYRKLAAADPDRWLVVDGAADVDEVAARVRGAFDRWVAASSLS